jgi:hypothetical protein
VIYFIQAGATGPIKIGYSCRPPARRSNLQTAHYEELRVLATLPGDKDDEQTIRRKFKKHRIRGEWFYPAMQILVYIAQINANDLRSSDTVTRHARKHYFPYGKWTCADGREVLFNRFYKPILQRMPGSSPEDADPTERVLWIKQEWFYDDRTADKVQAAADALRKWTGETMPPPAAAARGPRPELADE